MPTQEYKGYTLNTPRQAESETGWRELGNFKKLIDKDEALQTQITAETTARLGGDASLTGQLNVISARVGTLEGQVKYLERTFRVEVVLNYNAVWSTTQHLSAAVLGYFTTNEYGWTPSGAINLANYGFCAPSSADMSGVCHIEAMVRSANGVCVPAGPLDAPKMVSSFRAACQTIDGGYESYVGDWTIDSPSCSVYSVPEMSPYNYGVGIAPEGAINGVVLTARPQAAGSSVVVVFTLKQVA